MLIEKIGRDEKICIVTSYACFALAMFCLWKGALELGIAASLAGLIQASTGMILRNFRRSLKAQGPNT